MITDRDTKIRAAVIVQYCQSDIYKHDLNTLFFKLFKHLNNQRVPELISFVDDTEEDFFGQHHFYDDDDRDFEKLMRKWSQGNRSTKMVSRIMENYIANYISKAQVPKGYPECRHSKELREYMSKFSRLNLKAFFEFLVERAILFARIKPRTKA